jgi:hypothetical protein
MVIKSVSDSALQGIQRGLQGVRRNAAEIASARQMRNSSAAPKDLTRSLVELKQHQLQTSASIEAFRTESELIGHLLDVKA